MMQMLEAGGLPALTDKVRQADTDNPRGYYEFEPVKKTKDDSSWVAEAVGKVVKMVYKLVYDLPQDCQYRIILMERNLQEVLLSQKRMLDRLGREESGIEDEKFAELFSHQLAEFKQWTAKQKHISLLYVNHREVIENPANQAKKINEFLGGGLDVETMAACVDPSLYRNRR